jgi:hypothetical protein
MQNGTVYADGSLLDIDLAEILYNEARNHFSNGELKPEVNVLLNIGSSDRPDVSFRSNIESHRGTYLRINSTSLPRMDLELTEWQSLGSSIARTEILLEQADIKMEMSRTISKWFGEIGWSNYL